MPSSRRRAYLISLSFGTVVASTGVGSQTPLASPGVDLSWVTPKAGHAFLPGDVILFRWKADAADTNLPDTFSLCMGDAFDPDLGDDERAFNTSAGSAVGQEAAAGLDAQLGLTASNTTQMHTRRSSETLICGDRVWANVHHVQSVYSVAFIAPNVSSSVPFFLQTYHGPNPIGPSPSFTLRGPKILYSSPPKVSKGVIATIAVPTSLFVIIALLACSSVVRQRLRANKAAKAACNPNKPRIMLDDSFTRPTPVQLPPVDPVPRPLARQLTSSLHGWRQSVFSRSGQRDAPGAVQGDMTRAVRSEADFEKVLALADAMEVFAARRPRHQNSYTSLPERSGRWSRRWSAIYPTSKHLSDTYSEQSSHDSTAYEGSSPTGTLGMSETSTPQVRRADRAHMQLPRLVVPPMPRPPPPPSSLSNAYESAHAEFVSHESHLQMMEPALPTPIATVPPREPPLPLRPIPHPHALTASVMTVPRITPDPVSIRMATSSSFYTDASPTPSPIRDDDLYARVQHATSRRS